MSRYEQPAAGEWIQPIRHGYKLACCDCGLVHRMEFRVVAGRAQFRAYRDNRATATSRGNRTKEARMGVRGFRGRWGSGDLAQQVRKKAIKKLSRKRWNKPPERRKR